MLFLLGEAFRLAAAGRHHARGSAHRGGRRIAAAMFVGKLGFQIVEEAVEFAKSCWRASERSRSDAHP